MPNVNIWAGYDPRANIWKQWNTFEMLTLSSEKANLCTSVDIKFNKKKNARKKSEKSAFSGENSLSRYVED